MPRENGARHWTEPSSGRWNWPNAWVTTRPPWRWRMSLLATAKANGIEPHAWLTDVLTRLSTTKDRDIDTLLPLA